MHAVRRSGTACELKLAHEFVTLHLEFETNVRVLAKNRTQPDFVFPKAKVAIFVDGCFWHGCPEHGSVPRANRAWWKKKIADNKTRDLRNLRLLRAHGWTARRFWAHEESNRIALRVLRILKVRARG
jgi:DNA mismatch endonuclease (patch repair protein)